MNEVNGSCAVCGGDTAYDGRIPILCKTCRAARERIKNGTCNVTDPNTMSFITNPTIAFRLTLPDADLVPKPKIG